MRRFQIFTDNGCIASFKTKSEANKFFREWVEYKKSHKSPATISLVDAEINKTLRTKTIKF